MKRDKVFEVTINGVTYESIDDMPAELQSAGQKLVENMEGISDGDDSDFQEAYSELAQTIGTRDPKITIKKTTAYKSIRFTKNLNNRKNKSNENNFNKYSKSPP